MPPPRTPAVGEDRHDVALSGTITATTTHPAFSTEDDVTLEVTQAVSAASGTGPTYDLRLETSVDGTNWDTVTPSGGAFAQRTAAGAARGKAFAGLGRQCRFVETLGGTTPSFTRTVTVRAYRGF